MRALPWLWTAAIAGMAAWLSSGALPGVHLPDPAHVAMHVGLFAALAAMLVGRIGPNAAFFMTMCAGALVELAQMAASGRFLSEAAYDLAVDALGAALGAVAIGGRPAAAGAGVWLHPVGLAPAALFGITWAALGDATRSTAWTLAMLAGWLPAVLAWAWGARAGWYPGLDELDARERAPVFAVAAVGSTLAAVALGAAAPPDVGRLAIGMAAVAAITRGGFKISGHVAVPLLLAVGAGPHTGRGAVVLVGLGALLAVARVRAGRHTPREVLASFGLAGAAFAVDLGRGAL